MDYPGSSVHLREADANELRRSLARSVSYGAQKVARLTEGVLKEACQDHFSNPIQLVANVCKALDPAWRPFYLLKHRFQLPTASQVRSATRSSALPTA